MSAGVDFGTYRSVVSRLQNGRPHELPLGALQGEWDVPSLVFLPSEGGGALFGSAARIRTEKLGPQPDSGVSIANLKLDLADPAKTWSANGASYTVDQLYQGMAAHLLELCRDRSPDFRSEGACFTLPCFIGLARQEQLRKLLVRAGWKAPRFLQEPAAALCGVWSGQALESGTYLVVDVGHGSCDLGLAQVEGAGDSLEIQELFFVGNTWVSGEEIDKAFFQGLTENHPEFVPTDRCRFKRVRGEIETQLRRAKEGLSFQDRADLFVASFPNSDGFLELDISRDEFESSVEAAGLLSMLAQVARFALSRLGQQAGPVRVLFTGRSSLPPILRRVVEEALPGCLFVPPFDRPELAKLAVAHGAALYAAGEIGVRYQRAAARALHLAGHDPSKPLVDIGSALPLTRQVSVDVQGGRQDLVVLEQAAGGGPSELCRVRMPDRVRGAGPTSTFQVALKVDVSEDGSPTVQVISSRAI